MVGKVGIRVYKIFIKNDAEKLNAALDDSRLQEDFCEFLKSYISEKSAVNSNPSIERTFYIENKTNLKFRNQGYIHYGTYGFESIIIDSKNKKEKYKRLMSDVEQIPLYYDIYVESGFRYCLTAFQSFQGRSCVTYLMNDMAKVFSEKNTGFSLHYVKLAPELDKNTFKSLPVRQLRLKRPKILNDRADQYKNPFAGVEYSIELQMTASKKKSLGSLGDLFGLFSKTRDGLIEFEGGRYNEVDAEVRLNNRVRRISIFGNESTVGVIDVSEDILFDRNGHPEYNSLKKEVENILTGYVERMKAK